MSPLQPAFDQILAQTPLLVAKKASETPHIDYSSLKMDEHWLRDKTKTAARAAGSPLKHSQIVRVVLDEVQETLDKHHITRETDRLVLLQAAYDERVAVQRMVACNEHSPGLALFHLAERTNDRSTVSYITVHPDVPEDALGVILLRFMEDKQVVQYVLESKACTARLATIVWNKYENDGTILHYVLKVNDCPSEIVAVGAASDDYHRYIAAKHPNLPEQFFGPLSQDEDEDVREAIASRPDLSADLYVALAGDSCDIVRAAVAENPAADRKARLFATL